MHCPKCNTEVAGNNTICPQCGHELPVTPSPDITSATPHITSFSIPPTPQTPPSRSVGKKHSYLWLVFTLIFLALAYVGIYTFNLFPAVNPLEKSRLSQDSSVKKYIDNLVSGLNNYVASHAQYPWTGNSIDGYSSLDVTSEPWIDDLATAPNSPFNPQQLAMIKTLPFKLILIQEVGTSQAFHLCYRPLSQADKATAKDKCFSDHFYQQYSASICVRDREYLCFP
jgi:hypothetical protein